MATPNKTNIYDCCTALRALDLGMEAVANLRNENRRDAVPFAALGGVAVCIWQAVAAKGNEQELAALASRGTDDVDVEIKHNDPAALFDHIRKSLRAPKEPVPTDPSTVDKHDCFLPPVLMTTARGILVGHNSAGTDITRFVRSAADKALYHTLDVGFDIRSEAKSQLLVLMPRDDIWTHITRVTPPGIDKAQPPQSPLPVFRTPIVFVLKVRAFLDKSKDDAQAAKHLVDLGRLVRIQSKVELSPETVGQVTAVMQKQNPELLKQLQQAVKGLDNRWAEVAAAAEQKVSPGKEITPDAWLELFKGIQKLMGS